MSVIEPSFLPVIRSSSRPAAGIVRAVIHHGGDSTAPADHRDCIARVKSYDAYHRAPKPRGRGWAGLGYHRIGCAHGIVWEGRGLLQVGAHSQPANRDGIGYCYIGGDEPMPAAALAAFAAAIRQDAAELGRPLSLWGHGVGTPAVEPGTTLCPGRGITAQLDELRALVAGVSAPVRPSPAGPTTPAPPDRPAGGHTDTSTEAIVRQLPTLQRGDRGRHVGIWQGILLAHELPVGSRDGRPDEDFGPTTERSTRRLQQRAGVNADGIVGIRETWPAGLGVR